MTPARPLSRAIAGALLDGEWQVEAMRARLAAAFGEERLWMRSVVRHAASAFAVAPLDAPRALARWVRARRAFAVALRDRLTVRRWPLARERMAAQVWPVPAIDTLGDLAAWLDIEVPALEALADRRGFSRNAGPRARHYRYRWVPKRWGGWRLIEAPKLRLRTIQRLILDRILAHIPPHDAAYGFRAGRSVPEFARVHVGQPVVIRADQRSFFTSVSAGRVLGIFRSAGYPEQVARTLAALCTHATPRDVLATVDFDERRALQVAHLPRARRRRERWLTWPLIA